MRFQGVWWSSSLQTGDISGNFSFLAGREILKKILRNIRLGQVATYLEVVAGVIRHETDWAQRGEAGTIVGRAVSDAVLDDGTINLDELGAIAHKHPQRGITKYMHPHLTRRHREIHAWNDDAKIAHDGSAWWGADATANAYVTTKDTAIGNKEAVFWLCHKLVHSKTTRLVNVQVTGGWPVTCYALGTTTPFYYLVANQQAL